jgi:serine/threonine protein kinase
MYVNENSQQLSEDKWEKQHKIGSGSYGSVYKGIDKTTQQQIAIKKIKAPLEDDGVPVEILREIIILRNISHPNVIK